MILSLKVLLDKLNQLPKRHQSLILGIDGGGGAGKSTLARKLQELGKNVTVVHTDDFYRPSVERKQVDPMEVGGNWDWERIREQVLTPINNDLNGRYQEYDWRIDQMTDWHNVPTGSLVIIEGCYSIRKELADLYDFRIWVESPKSLRLNRGIERDGEASRHLWEDLWLPGEEHYIKVQQPTRYADLVVDGTGEYGNIDNDEIKIISLPNSWCE